MPELNSAASELPPLAPSFGSVSDSDSIPSLEAEPQFSQQDPSELLVQQSDEVPPPPQDNESLLGLIKGKLSGAGKTPWRTEGSEKIPPAGEVPIDEAGVEVLRKYLLIREEELSHAMREKQNLLAMHDKLESDIQTFQKKVRELEHIKEDKAKEVSRLSRESSDKERDLVDQKDQAEFEKETLMDRVRFLESELKESKDKYSTLKDRVRRDIRKIQSREKELETRLELIKRDSETLIRERDKQVLGLRRKIDAMEFDLDLIQDRKVQAENNADKYVDKISRVAKTLQVAFGMLEEEENDQDEDDLEPVTGGAAESIDEDTDSIQIDAEGVVDEDDEGYSGAEEPLGATAVEELLKKKVDDLSEAEVEDAEAATQIFSANDADALLAGEAEAGVEAEEDTGEEALFDSLDITDDESDDGMGEAMGS